MDFEIRVDTYFDRRWMAAEMTDAALRQKLKGWLQERDRARAANDFNRWSTAIEWIEVLRDEQEARRNPQPADDVDEATS